MLIHKELGNIQEIKKEIQNIRYDCYKKENYLQFTNTCYDINL